MVAELFSAAPILAARALLRLLPRLLGPEVWRALAAGSAIRLKFSGLLQEVVRSVMVSKPAEETPCIGFPMPDLNCPSIQLVEGSICEAVYSTDVACHGAYP